MLLVITNTAHCFYIAVETWVAYYTDMTTSVRSWFMTQVIINVDTETILNGEWLKIFENWKVYYAENKWIKLKFAFSVRKTVLKFSAFFGEYQAIHKILFKNKTCWMCIQNIVSYNLKVLIKVFYLFVLYIVCINKFILLLMILINRFVKCLLWINDNNYK